MSKQKNLEQRATRTIPHSIKKIFINKRCKSIEKTETTCQTK